MTEEIKEILDRIKDINNYDSTTTYEDNKITEEYDMYISKEDVDKLLDYITNLQQENEKLKYNARGQVNDYFKDKYADEVLKKADLIKDFELTCYKNYELKQENETLNNIMNDFEDWLKNNFWNDDEGNESYQIEKYTTYYSVYRKLDLLKTLYRGDKK